LKETATLPFTSASISQKRSSHCKKVKMAMFLVPFKIDPGIHQSLLLDPVEQPVADEQGQVTFTEELKGMAEQVDKDIKPVYIE
jgi:hypothetical protein